MRRLILPPAARRDFADILASLIRDSGEHEASRRFVPSIRDQCSRIVSLPGTLDRARPELAPGLRGIPFRQYVNVFRYEPDRLRIVRIVEGHRDRAAQLPSMPR